MKFWQKFSNNLGAFLLLLFVTMISAVFINYYCKFFSDFDLAAEERLINSPLLAFFITPIFFWVSAYLCRRFAQNASGSGLVHLESAIDELKKHPKNPDKISKFLSLRIVLVETVSSLLLSFGGGALGREGPSVQMSASIFVAAAQKFKSIFSKINLESWIIAGSGAGLAFAFNAPIAGFIYALEKSLKIRSNNFNPNINLAMLTAIISALILQKFEPLFLLPSLNFEYGLELSFIAFVAILCGLFSVIFVRINVYFYYRIVAIKSNYWHLIPIAIGFLVSLISLSIGVNSIGGGIKNTQEILSGLVVISPLEVMGRFINVILSFIAGCSGGLVAPSIAIGAGIGSLGSILAPYLDTKIFILSGMAAFLSATIGQPIAAAVVILEITNQSVFAFPVLFFASLIAFLCTKIIRK